ncbi:MAG TPA: hypothetical protein VGD17_13080 [Chitinophagaceae bacterium]
MEHYESPLIDNRKKTIQFTIHNNCASQISLAGSFNHWAKDELLLKPGKNGKWQIQIPLLPKGQYYYKFFIDDRMWVEDIDNPYRVPDGVTGWNSVLTVSD